MSILYLSNMLSRDAQRILTDNGYSIYPKNQQITITNAKKPVGIYIFVFIVLVISIPIFLMYVHPIAALVSGMIAVFPAYAILKGTEVPDSVRINPAEHCVDLISFSGVASKSLHFNEIEKVVVRSIQETHAASALEDDVASMIYYLCFNIKSKTIDVLRFTESTKEELLKVKEELMLMVKEPA